MGRRTRGLPWALLVLGISLQSAAAQVADTATYADSATAALIAAARYRHTQQNSLVDDYQAVVRTRIDATVGHSRFSRMVPLAAYETIARVIWHRPNDLRLVVLGVRQRSIFPDAEMEVGYDRPWFVPRGLGDSIQLMGVPETGALNPLAPGADVYYRYAIADSTIVAIPGRTIRTIRVRVTPKRVGPSLVAGDLWIDGTTDDVVRMAVTFLGEMMWDAPGPDASAKDSAEARKGNKWARRFLSVDAELEYALVDGKYWMPYRQLLDITFRAGSFINFAVPFRAITTFQDYDVNTGVIPVFRLPPPDSGHRTRREVRCENCDSLHAGRKLRRQLGFDREGRWGGDATGVAGRWEISVPPMDSLRDYRWPDSLTFAPDPADARRIRETVANLARMEEDLPGAWVGRPTATVAWNRLADIIRFNRVQGLSFGLGYEVRPGPPFSVLRATARFGLSDQRLTGSLAWRHDGPGASWRLTALHDVAEVEPWTGGISLGNSINAAFAGHDYADYYLRSGASIDYVANTGRLANVEFRLAAERERTMAVESGSRLNDWLGGSGNLGPNPPVAEGDYLRASVAKTWELGAASVRPGVDAAIGDSAAARLWATARVRGWKRRAVLSLKAGRSFGARLPQLLFRVGGPQTVRGYPYGALRGDALWSGQLDIALRRSWLATPVVFADAGGTFSANDPLVGAGFGWSFFGGFFRLNLAKGLDPARAVRFDLLFTAPR